MTNVSCPKPGGEISSPTCSLKTELAEEFVDANATALYLKIPVQTVRNMTSNGKLPYYKFGRLVRYRICDLRRLLLDQARGVHYGNKVYKRVGRV